MFKFKLSKSTLQMITFVFCVVIVYKVYKEMTCKCNKGKKRMSIPNMNKYDSLTAPELEFKVHEAKETLNKLDNANLTHVMPGMYDAAVSTLNSVTDHKYDNFNNIEVTRMNAIPDY